MYICIHIYIYIYYCNVMEKTWYVWYQSHEDTLFNIYKYTFIYVYICVCVYIYILLYI